MQIAMTVLIIWLVCSVVAFYQLFWTHYGTFDPHDDWPQHPSPQLPLGQVKSLFLSDTEWQGVLISDRNCQCTSFAKEHLQRLQQRYKTVEFKEIELLDVEQLEATFDLKIVATPLFILFKNKQLVYAGPLATDLVCSDQASILEGIIQGTTQLPGIWLNSESTACRCLP
jgi:hypothetical protein